MKINILITSLIISVCCASAFAHKDRIILLKENNLEGLPEQYEPAIFSYETKELTIGKNSVVIPDCIWNLFGEATASEFKFSASWYHKKSDLPPYIHIGTHRSDFFLLLNLDTLEIIEDLWFRKPPSECLEKWKPVKKPQPVK